MNYSYTRNPQQIFVERNFFGFVASDITLYEKNFKTLELNSNFYNRETDETNTMTFQNCMILQFPSSNSILKIVKDLKFLEVSNCNISKIFGQDLFGMSSLTSLNLQRNNIDYLPGM